MPRKTRVLVADEDGIMRDGLCALLQSDDALEVVAATAIRGDALQTLTTAQPDIIIIDFAADIKSGPETIAQVRRRWPDVRVLVLTVRRDETFIETALRAGADGYVLKTDSRTELFNAVHRIVSGKGYISPSALDRMVTAYAKTSDRLPPCGGCPDQPRAGSHHADRQGLSHARDGAVDVAQPQDCGEAPHQSHAQARPAIRGRGRRLRDHARVRLTVFDLASGPEHREERVLHRCTSRQDFGQSGKVR